MAIKGNSAHSKSNTSTKPKSVAKPKSADKPKSCVSKQVSVNVSKPATDATLYYGF